MSYQDLIISKAVNEAKRVVPEINDFNLPPGYLPMKCPYCRFDRFESRCDPYTQTDYLVCMKCNACVEMTTTVKQMVESQ